MNALPHPLSYRRAIISFAALFALFLAVTVAVVISHERDMLDSARAEAQEELELVATLMRESFLKNDYATVEEFLRQWGEEREDLVEVRATAPSGFVLADYRRTAPSRHTFGISTQVAVDGRVYVTLEVVKDFTHIRMSLYRLGATFIGGAVLLTASLGFALWYSLRRFALGPLEAEIARRKRAEEELERARDTLEERVTERTEELTREIEMAQRYLDVAGVMFVVIGADERVQLINQKGAEILGYREEEIIGKNWFDNFLPERKRDEVRKVFRMLMAGEVEPVEYFENPIVARGGEEKIIAWRNVLIRDEKGRPLATLSSGEDITKRKQAEEMLAYSESYLRSIIEAEPECVKVVAPDGTVLQMNPAGLRMCEVEDTEQVIGNSFFDIIAPEHRESVAAFLQSVCAGHPGTHEFEIVGFKGTRRWMESHAVPFKKERGGAIHMLAVTRDVTERRRLEQRLQQARKMEAIGTLTGGIAHDFNNILSAIIGFGESLEMEMAKDDPKRPYLEQMLAAAEKGANLTHSLLAFGRKLVIRPSPVRLNTIVSEVEKMVRGLIGENIKLEIVAAGPMATVMADASHIEQALINLVTNARDAMPNGGVLRIIADEVVMDADFIREHGFGKPGRYGLLSVTDTGIGMDESTRRRIFEPFFTTKAPGMGTGLGLSTVYGIVKQHGGYIDVWSEPGKGSAFDIYIPLVRIEARKEAEGPSAPPLVGGSETVLVAEDDPAVRKITRDALERFGYRVYEAADGLEAVDVFEKHMDEIDLLVLDVVMPKMSGKEAYYEVTNMKPGVKVLFTSGHVPEIVNRELIDLGLGLDFLPKPSSPRQLLRKVREVLDRGSGAPRS